MAMPPAGSSRASDSRPILTTGKAHIEDSQFWERLGIFIMVAGNAKKMIDIAEEDLAQAVGLVPKMFQDIKDHVIDLATETEKEIAKTSREQAIAVMRRQDAYDMPLNNTRRNDEMRATHRRVSELAGKERFLKQKLRFLKNAQVEVQNRRQKTVRMAHKIGAMVSLFSI